MYQGPMFNKLVIVIRSKPRVPFSHHRHRLLSHRSTTTKTKTTTTTTTTTSVTESAPTAIQKKPLNATPKNIPIERQVSAKSNGNGVIINDQTTSSKRTSLRILSSCSLLSFFGYCIYTRKKREQQLVDLPLAKDCGLFYVGDNNSKKNTTNDKKALKRDLHVVETIIARNGLMGKQATVKKELDDIRSWHQNHGYKGGIVLRDLSTNLYQPEYEYEDEALGGGGDVECIDIAIKPEKIRQRECYYLYYEIKPNGQTLHQIFCRGTTISDDVFTCLQSHLVYDDELAIRVHSGFRDHANRLIDDALPLLGPPHSIRSTVEVSGHSLGGAVAYIVSMKLKKRGYNVSKVTAVAGARFCHPDDVTLANNLLPKDALRIEDDLDIVPFLPAWANSVGDKLWLITKFNDSNGNDSSLPLDSKYITRDVLHHHHHQQQQQGPFSWVDGWWNNVRLPEMICSIEKVHRIRSYRSKVQNLIDTMTKADAETQAIFESHSTNLSSNNQLTMDVIESNHGSGQ